MLSPPPSARIFSQPLKIDVNYKCWSILPLCVAGNIVSLGHHDSLAPLQQSYWSLAPSLLLFKSIFTQHWGGQSTQQATTINLLMVPVHLMHGLCPVSEYHSDPPLRFLSHSFKTQFRCQLLQEAFADLHPSHSTPSQSIWGPFLFGTQIKWVTSITNLQLYYNLLLSCVIFPNRM